MPVTLSIKNAPDDMVQRLRERARKNHRSLQGEMLSILEHVVSAPAVQASRDPDEGARSGDRRVPSESTAAPREARTGNRVIRFEGEHEDG